jgi:hypothetical protein
MISDPTNMFCNAFLEIVSYSGKGLFWIKAMRGSKIKDIDYKFKVMTFPVVYNEV